MTTSIAPPFSQQYTTSASLQQPQFFTNQQHQQNYNTSFINQQLNQQQSESMLNTSDEFAQVFDDSVYVLSNNEINWLAVRQDIPLQYYPKITKKHLISKFKSLEDFIDSIPLEFYTINDFKTSLTKPSTQDLPKHSLSQRIKANNAKATKDVEYPTQTDNRSNLLHDVTFCHAPLIPAKNLLLLRKERNPPVKPISNYDLSHIKWTGRIHDSVWEKLHDLSCKDIRLRNFFTKDPVLQSSTNKLTIKAASDSSETFDIEQRIHSDTFDSVSQVKSAILVLMEAQQAIFPHDKRTAIINKFITDKGDFYKDLRDKLGITSMLARAKFIERFVDMCTEENAVKYSNGEEHFNLDTLDTRYLNILNSHEIRDVLHETVIEDRRREDQRRSDNNLVYRNQNRFNSRNPTNPFQNRFRSPNPNFRQQGPKQTKKELFDSICKEYNDKNGCTRQYDRNLNSCKLNSNTRLFHICNYDKPDHLFCLSKTHNASTHDPVLHDGDTKPSPNRR